MGVLQVKGRATTQGDIGIQRISFLVFQCLKVPRGQLCLRAEVNSYQVVFNQQLKKDAVNNGSVTVF